MATAIAAYRRQLRGPDAVIALAPHLRDHCIDYGFPAERIEVIPNTTTDPGEPTPLGSGLLFAARFSAEKGLALLAEAWARLPLARRRPAHDRRRRAGAAGRGRSRRIEARRRLPRPGRAERRSRRLLRATAAVVVPSRWQEVCPTIVVDALAHGRPVLATDRGGLPYLVGSDGGWLVSPSPGALADGIRRAVAGAPAKAAGARQRFLDAMAPDVVLTRTTDLYERLRAA